MKEIHVEVITPAEEAYSGDVMAITIPGTIGSFQVLYNHAPLISSFEIGKIKIKENENTEKIYATSGGTVEVKDNKVLVLAESFESPDEIDIERARNAKERAEERLTIEKRREFDVDRAELALKRAINRLKIAKVL